MFTWACMSNWIANLFLVPRTLVFKQIFIRHGFTSWLSKEKPVTQTFNHHLSDHNLVEPTRRQHYNWELFSYLDFFIEFTELHKAKIGTNLAVFLSDKKFTSLDELRTTMHLEKDNGKISGFFFLLNSLNSVNGPNRKNKISLSICFRKNSPLLVQRSVTK